MEQRLVDVRHESGRVAERIAIMERSEERSRLLTRQELILAKIDANAETWAVLTLCKTLLDETRKIYETERQPEVLRQASLFFKVMTEGRYIRVIAPLDGAEIQVERADGVRLPPQLLSRERPSSSIWPCGWLWFANMPHTSMRFPWFLTMSSSISIPRARAIRCRRFANLPRPIRCFFSRAIRIS